MKMKKIIILAIFTGLTILNIIGIFAFMKVNSSPSTVELEKILDFSREYDVKLDTEFIRSNLSPAYE